MFISKLKQIFVFTLCIVSFTNGFAHEAPVYDVDNYPPQFDGQEDSSTSSSVPRVAPTDMPEAPKAQSDADQQTSSYVPDPSLSVEQRVARLEQQINNVLHSDVTTKMDAVQADMQLLRGQIEELTHQIQQLQTQQKSMYSDLDKRIHRPATDLTEPASEAPKTEADDTIPDTSSTKLKMAPAANLKSAKASAAADQPSVAEEQAIYQSAYSLIKAKKYSQAASALQKMLQKYPSGQSAGNAHYWLGELYGLLGKNDQAVSEFGIVVKNYPESAKLADAQLKLGLIYAAQFKWTDAKSSFRLVINHYPGTPSARLAAEQLKQIKQAGH